MSLVDVASQVSTELTAKQLRAQYKDNPVLWARQVGGYHLWSAQAEAAMSVARNQNTAVKAGHGVGKSFLAALLICWWIDTRYPDCFVASTAPSQAQIGAIVWREVEGIATRIRKRYEEGLVDHKLPGYRTSGSYPEWKTDEGVVIGFGRKPVDREGHTGDSFQGIHASAGVLAIGDESVGLSEELIDALGNITSTKNSRRMLICNPTNPASYMAKLFKSQHSNWSYHTISVLNNPNFTDEGKTTPPDVLEALSDETFLDQKREEYGVGSPQWVARIEGEFAWDMGFTLFRDTDITKGYDTNLDVPSETLPVLGVDVSRSKAGDTNTVYENRGGVLRYVDEWNDPNAMNTAQKIHETALARGAVEVRIDGVGLGGPIADRVRELSQDKYLVIEILGGDPSPDRKRFYNWRAFSFWSFQDNLSKGLIDLDVEDTQLADELMGIEIKKRASGVDNLLLESKEDMRKRGVKSPNRADAANYAALDLSAWTGNPWNQYEEGAAVTQDREDLMRGLDDLPMFGAGLPML